jgi:hypothetical protein
MKNVRQLLILSNPHPDGVTDNFAYSLATAALGMGLIDLSGETLMQVWPHVGACLRHFHLSEPGLGGFRTPLAPHATNLQWLSDHAYSGYVSIEMLDSGDPLDEVGPWRLLEPFRRDHLLLE